MNRACSSAFRAFGTVKRHPSPLFKSLQKLYKKRKGHQLGRSFFSREWLSFRFSATTSKRCRKVEYHVFSWNSIRKVTTREWYIDSTSRSSNITLQRNIGDGEYLSLVIRADEKGDVQYLGKDVHMISIHCIHNINCTEDYITKQLCYTISFSTCNLNVAFTITLDWHQRNVFPKSSILMGYLISRYVMLEIIVPLQIPIMYIQEDPACIYLRIFQRSIECILIFKSSIECYLQRYGINHDMLSIYILMINGIVLFNSTFLDIQ